MNNRRKSLHNNGQCTTLPVNGESHDGWEDCGQYGEQRKAYFIMSRRESINEKEEEMRKTRKQTHTSTRPKASKPENMPDSAPSLDPASIQRVIQGEHAKYNHQAAGAIASCEAHLVSLDMPMIVLRKLKGILNAIEMQIEDFAMTPAVLIALCQAYTAQVSIFKEPYRTQLLEAFQGCAQAILASFSDRLSVEEMNAIKAPLLHV